MKRSPIKAALQGDLDRLCGLYSLANAIAYLYDGRVKRRSLLIALLKAYQQRWDLAELIKWGFDPVEMDYLIESVLMKGYYHRHYPVVITKPFSGKQHLRTGGVFRKMEAFLKAAEAPGLRVVLMGTHYHWSVARRFDRIFIYFFDSIGMDRVPRRRYSVMPGKARYHLVPDAIYFIERRLEDW
jgi:hypothetical protein